MVAAGGNGVLDSILGTDLTVDRLIAELPFLLLVLAMFQGRVNRMRAVVAVAALTGFAHANRSRMRK